VAALISIDGFLARRNLFTQQSRNVKAQSPCRCSAKTVQKIQKKSVPDFLPHPPNSQNAASCFQQKPEIFLFARIAGN